jgi:hypothetical protein
MAFVATLEVRAGQQNRCFQRGDSLQSLSR